MKMFKNKKNEEFSSSPIEDKEWFKLPGQLVIDLYREKDELVVMAPIAGAENKDIEVFIESGILKIKGKREKKEEDVGKSYFMKECYWGEFSREIVLPVDVDGKRTKADIKEGILIIRMPIIEQEEIEKVNLN